MSIYDHFRAEETVLVDQALDWKEAAEQYHKMKLTDFLDPREQQIVSMIIGSQSEAAVQFFGAFNEAERKRALIYPAYLQPEQEEFQVDVLEIAYAAKFHTIEHRQVLGSLMSLGLKRGKYGDIVLQQERIQLAAAKEVRDYIQLNLQSIGRASVSFSTVAAEDILQQEEEWFEKSGTISSMRLDVVIAELFGLSRQKAAPLIKNGLVKVNWKVIEQPSYECYEGDAFSVRGYGRGKLLTIDGKSKREKWKIVYGLRK